MYFVIAMLVLTVGVFADSDTKEEVKNFMKEKGIEVKNITEVDFGDLPEEINIEKMDNTNIVIYEVDYGAKPLFVITSSDKEFQKDVPTACDARALLSFGFNGKIGNSSFLNTASGIGGSLEKGYVMMRKGSITSISTNLEIVKNDEGYIDIIIYKNGELVRFGNTIDASSEGIKKDYDVQSKDIVIFEPGDTISVQVKIQGKVMLKDIITIVEITTD